MVFKSLTFSLAVFGALAASPSDWLGQKIEQVQGQIDSSRLDKDSKAELSGLLGRAKKEQEAGRPYYALKQLSLSITNLKAYTYPGAHLAAAKERGAYDKAFASYAPTIRAELSKSVGRLPSAQLGLVQRSRNKAKPLFDAGQAYGYEAGLDQGLSYLGMADGFLEYANWCGQTPFAAPAKSSLRSVEPELSDLDARVLNAFDKSTVAQQGDFIPVNDAMKEAHEMDARGWYPGAAIAYLEAEFLVARRAPATMTAAGVQEVLSNRKSELSKLPGDNTVGQLYVEAAESALAGGRLGDAEALVKSVLPRYIKVVTTKAAVMRAGKKGVGITVTLVRWPYSCSISDPASLLAREVVRQFPDDVKFVSEDLSHSALARRFNLKEYPALFVNDVLVAQPSDFTAFWADKRSGKYVPFDKQENRDKFKADMSTVINMFRKGDAQSAARRGEKPVASAMAASFPDVQLTDLRGNAVTAATLKGKAVIVECWAPWCPPCRETLAWLDSVIKKRGDSLTVVGLAVMCKESEVRDYLLRKPSRATIAMGSASVQAKFGSFVSVPQLFIYDASGKLVKSLVGATPANHGIVEKTLDALS